MLHALYAAREIAALLIFVLTPCAVWEKALSPSPLQYAAERRIDGGGFKDSDGTSCAGNPLDRPILAGVRLTVFAFRVRRRQKLKAKPATIPSVSSGRAQQKPYEARHTVEIIKRRGLRQILAKHLVFICNKVALTALF